MSERAPPTGGYPATQTAPRTPTTPAPGGAGDADDDRTRMPGAAGPVSSSASTTPGAGANANASALSRGHRLHEFVIEDTLGVGGFGIVYRAHDQQLRRTVAIKEYMPSSLAVRREDGSVGLRSDRQRDTFELGLRSFINEAQLLAAFEHPALLKVYRFWEQHGSAYMVMPCYDGLTLKAWLAGRSEPPGEAWWRPRLLALADALAMMHRERCYHRDIAPDNILLVGPTLQPVLLDFGAARRVVGDATQSLTVILKPGYAPIEQYAESTALKQGPWTDVYALCAVLQAAITGSAPPPSVARVVHDERPGVRQFVARRTPGPDRAVYSDAFLDGIDAGLAVRPEDRPQDMAALMQRLGLDSLNRAAKDASAAPGPAAPERQAGAHDHAHGHAQDNAHGHAHGHAQGEAKDHAPGPAAAGGPGAQARSRMTIPALAALGLGAATLIGGLAWWRLVGAPQPTPSTVAASGPRTLPPPSADTALTSTVTPAAPPAASPAASPAETHAETHAETPAALARPAYTPVRVLDELVALADPSIAVQASADRAQVVIGRDRLQFRVRANVAGHVYVYLVGTEGRRVELLFPNTIDADNRIGRDQELTLPRPAWRITAGGPPGIDHLAVVVSPQPRDIAATGAKAAAGEMLRSFDDALAQSLWRAGDGKRSGFLGEADCRSAAAPCPTGHGATVVRIEEVAAR